MKKKSLIVHKAKFKSITVHIIFNCLVEAQSIDDVDDFMFPVSNVIRVVFDNGVGVVTMQVNTVHFLFYFFLKNLQTKYTHYAKLPKYPFLSPPNFFTKCIHLSLNLPHLPTAPLAVHTVTGVAGHSLIPQSSPTSNQYFYL
jgi:hypothetical protein